MDERVRKDVPDEKNKIMLRTRLTSVGVLAVGLAVGLLGFGCLVPSQPAAAASRGPAAGPPLIGGYKVVKIERTARAGAVSTATANCPGSKHVVGGGASGSASVGSFENINASYPSSTTAWTAAVTNTDSAHGIYYVYAICATVQGDYGAVFSQAYDNPAGSQVGAGAACPTKTSALGGGGYNTSNQLLVDLNTDGPETSGVGFASYTNNASNADNTTQAVAVCMTTPQGYDVVTGTGVTIPPGGQGEATSSCPSGTVVTGGGAFDSSTPTTVDLNASYPLDKTIWDAYENNDSSSSATMTAYAICATP
jgi:hypothetical protein